jgi:glycosyltransferase involved in cell wall biosynthesis
MRILWFSNSPALGREYLEGNSLKGTGGWLDSLSDFIKEDVDLHIAFHYPYKNEMFIYKNISYYPIYSGNIYLNLIKKKFINNPPDEEFLESYLEIISKVNPDVIHIHGTENSYLCILKHLKIPIVVSIQGNITIINHKYLSGFNGKYLYRSRNVTLRDFLLGPNNFYRNKVYYSKMSLIEQNRMKDIQYVIGRTDWDYRITRVLSPNSKYLKGEEILRKSFYNVHWKNIYSNGKLIIFTTSSDNYFKGIETVFQCISLLQKIGIDLEWRIAGITDYSLIKSISQSFLGLEFPKIGYKLLGALDEEELVHELLQSHIYVMPSHIENSPNSLCEAMILGMPCIATFAGGTGSILNDGEEGVLIQDGDPWALSGAIVELIKNPTLSDYYGQNARIRSLARHDKNMIIGQYIEIYKSVIIN